MIYVLDTDHLTALGRGGRAAQKLSAKIDEAEVYEITATIISYEEQTRGWFALIAQARTVERQVEVYRQLKNNLDDFCSFSMLVFDERAADTLRRLKQDRIRIGTMDLKIASIVLSSNATLLTRNLSDFNQVPGLQVENRLD